MSYVAMTREIAQWLINKGEDSVIIRETAYKMLFKPWMNRRELKERRKLEEASKFWVMALRVPLRAMSPIADAIEQSMGRIINSIPPQPDPTHPKLMNMKFELAPEAEGGFVLLLPLRLDDGEDINVELVCKHTPWCDRSKWWNHTATDGCPKLVQQRDGQEAEGDTADNFSQRNRQQLPPSILGGIKESTKDLPVEVPQQTVAESSIQATSRVQQRQGSGGTPQGIRIQPQHVQGQAAYVPTNMGPQQQVPQGGLPGSTSLQVGVTGAGFVPFRPNSVPVYHQGYGMGNPGVQNFPGIRNTIGEQAWQSSLLAAAGILSTELMGHVPTPQNVHNLGQAHVPETTRDLVVVQKDSNCKTGEFEAMVFADHKQENW
ncbi:hypothetical protein CBR_g3863 [Chara braunii]|uniref:Uncharacterized protein n=1 Tax=Chara braunii TaxID=69332 RepID=A0A388KGQ8_CHABU|nr:hypothetical protein CBR_g3863 [Chara braunii]|eukprot:GBG69163.1 hypothetical protein CBR_g3863 [Chara braunii]